MRKVLGIFGLLLILTATGCRTYQEVGGKPAPKAIGSIISLSPSTTEIIVSNSLVARLVGRTASCDYPAGLAEIPIVANQKPNFEKIVKINPDLIVYDKTLYSDQDIAKIKSLGIETMEYDVRSVDQLIDWLYRFGSKVRAETNVSVYVVKIESARERAKVANQGESPGVCVLLTDGSGHYMIAGLESFQADVVKSAGGRPLGPHAPKFVSTNIESIIKLNPDIILTEVGKGSSILKDPRLASIEAIANKNLFEIDPAVLERAGQRVDRLLSSLGELFSTQAK